MTLGNKPLDEFNKYSCKIIIKDKIIIRVQTARAHEHSVLSVSLAYVRVVHTPRPIHASASILMYRMNNECCIHHH